MEDFQFSKPERDYGDKDEFVEKSLGFDILSIDYEPKMGFGGDDRWSVKVMPYDGRGERVLTFAPNEKRDEQFSSARNHIKHHGIITNKRLIKVGRAHYFDNYAEEVQPTKNVDDEIPF